VVPFLKGDPIAPNGDCNTKEEESQADQKQKAAIARGLVVSIEDLIRNYKAL